MFAIMQHRDSLVYTYSTHATYIKCKFTYTTTSKFIKQHFKTNYNIFKDHDENFFYPIVLHINRSMTHCHLNYFPSSLTHSHWQLISQ